MNFFNASKALQVFIFEFPWPGPVYLVGDFNNWTASPAYEMRRKQSHWLIELELSKGEFRYGYEVRECLFEDTDSEHFQRRLGWPRSCARCPGQNHCKQAIKKSNHTKLVAPKSS